MPLLTKSKYMTGQQCLRLLAYSKLEINNGGDASALYFYSHILKEIDKGGIRENLLKYCCLDTEEWFG